MRRPHLLGALAFIGLAAAFLVALFLGSAPGHQATAVEWTIQVLMLVGAFLMVAGRAARS